MPLPASSQPMPHVVTGMAELSDRYDAFILDLWGVIHDGLNRYPGVGTCLKALKAQGKIIWFLSNAPRRASSAKAKLDDLGITPEMYDGILTSGEMAYLTLTETREPWVNDWGKNYFFIGPERDRAIMDGSGFTSTAMEEAGFLLNVGFDDDDLELENYLPVLEAARARNLPMYCVNPDRIIVRITGDTFPCAGLLADAYAERGGEVRYVGKPHASVYQHLLEKLSMPKEKILAVGDNFDTDIRGANDAGIDVALCTAGILTQELSLKPGELPLMEEVMHRVEKERAFPDYVIPAFNW